MKLTMDRERHEARIGGRLIRLSPREFDVLDALQRMDGRLLSQYELLRCVWGYEEGAARVVAALSHTVRQHISGVRKALRQALRGSDGLLVNVRGRGWKLLRKV